MTGIPCSLDPLGSGFGVPFQPQFVVFEGRPQPEQGGQDNINATVKLYRGIYNVIIAGGGRTRLMVVGVVLTALPAPVLRAISKLPKRLKLRFRSAPKPTKTPIR